MRYVLRKVAFYAVAAWAAITLNFALPRLMPGSPVDALLARLQKTGGATGPAQREAIEAMLGVSGNQNIVSQYFSYWAHLVRGDFGTSVTFYPSSVGSVIKDSLPWTVVLIGVATVISSVLGVVLGTFVGWKRGSWLDSLVPSTTFLASVPYFWLALVLIYFFALKLGWFPLAGGYDVDNTEIGFYSDFISSALYHAVLPAITIVISSVGGWLLGMRNMMVTTLSEDYVVTAEAKGLRSGRILVSYAARNAVLPSVAGFAISLGFVVSGSIVAETVFSYPGIGFALLQAVQNNDYALMQGIFLIITLAVLGANLIVDLLYGFIDPRTRNVG
ncbi:peptide/nickel transport system permease protein [Nakamurella sp. UYEF19]|uniref:ABC transporter permease n=1 Tax=Nakamurella sp. UYEF19 TaxID=1756392 RepID=UPI00339A89DC